MTPKERRELEESGLFVFDEPRIFASISKLAELCGVDRRTASARLKRAGLEGRDGPSNATLYPTDLAIPEIARG